MSKVLRSPLALSATVLAAGALAAGGAQVATSADKGRDEPVPASALQRAGELAAQAPTDYGPFAAVQVLTDPAEMRAAAAKVIEQTPFPPGRNSAAAYTWEGIPDGVTLDDVRDLVQYRATCDWYRALLEGGSDAAAEVRSVVSLTPKWLVFRDGGPKRQAVVDAALSGNPEALQRHVQINCQYHPGLKRAVR